MDSSEICEHYLKLAFENKPIDERFVYHANSDKIAVIIEPRLDKITEYVIYNFMHFLNPLGWNLLIIGYYGNHALIQETFPYALVFDIGDRHIIFDSSNNPNITINSYNQILLDPELWKNINAETILIFQQDCIMFRMFPEHFLLYDYAGSNYVENRSPLFGGINGGFSIRKKSVMLECLEKVTWEDIDEYRRTRKYTKCYELEPLLKLNEDVFFTHACEILCKTVPDKYHRLFLCVENDFNPNVAVHHGWNKCYMSILNAIFLLSSSPLFSAIPEPAYIPNE